MKIFKFIKEAIKFVALLPLAAFMMLIALLFIMPGILGLGFFIILLLSVFPGF